jgi:hypothetical protein
MTHQPSLSRRRFLTASATALAFPHIVRAQQPVLGQGDFRYRWIPEWGQLGKDTPVKNCHGIVCSQEGHLILLTDHTANNVVIYSREGKLVTKWGTCFPGAHGLSLVTQNGRETLFITDLATHRIEQTTLDGTKLAEWSWPEHSGKYQKGAEGGIVHWGPHGGMTDTAADGSAHLLVAMSDQQYLLQLDLSGKELRRIPLPGGNPRQIRRFGNHYVCAHLADNWPKDRNSRGFVSILDRDLRVISNVAATAPEYNVDHTLRPMRAEGEIFNHPHDAIVSPDGSLYVAQFASGNTYPLKFERV